VTLDPSGQAIHWMTVTPELPVHDVRETQLYYRDVLSCKIAWISDDESYGAIYCGQNELFFSRETGAFPGAVVCIRVTDIDRVYQAYREADLAIDYCEDIERLPDHDIDKIVSLFENAGAQAKISSIHVNGWFGDYDKLTMTAMMFEEVYGQRLEEVKDQVIFSGDSPNDVPMFAYFPNSVGVANVNQFEGKLDHYPAWVTEKEGGYGFAEMVNILLAGEKNAKKH
jgi:hypothetical protein